MVDGVVIDNELLIHLVQERPVLWDKTLDVFKNRNATRSAWQEVCVGIKNDFDELEDNQKNEFGKEVLKRWKHLRDAFAKSEKKDRESKASGSQAAKKKKYIFNDELQFLKKIYQDRNTAESSINEDEENNAEDDSRGDEQAHFPAEPPQEATVSGTAATGKKVDRKKIPLTRKHKKIDEVDLKIIQALDKKAPDINSSKLLFFHSLMPHVDAFNDDEWLQCQVEFLQVISKIKNKQLAVRQPQDFFSQPNPQFHQFGQPSQMNYPQQPYYTQIPQQSYSSTMPIYVQHSPIPAPTKTDPPSVKPMQEGSHSKSAAALHYETYSQVFDEDMDSHSPSVTSITSSSTPIDFTDL